VRCAVVSSNFCLPQQVTLVMQESLGAYRNDDFHICDASGESVTHLDTCVVRYLQNLMHGLLCAATAVANPLPIYHSRAIGPPRKEPNTGSWGPNKSKHSP
jgi:hypothetical protein